MPKQKTGQSCQQTIKVSKITHDDLFKARKILQVATFNSTIMILCERLFNSLQEPVNSEPLQKD